MNPSHAVFFLSLCLANYTTSLAQHTGTFGIKTGFSGSKLVFDTLGTGLQQTTQTQGGFYIAFFKDIYHNKGFSFLPSLGFIEKGGFNDIDIKNNQGITIKEERVYYHLGYINLSLYGKLSTKLDIPYLYPYLLFGPRIDFLQSHSSNLNYNLRKTEFGGIIGFGIDYDFPKVAVLAEFQRMLNLSPNLSANPTNKLNDKTFVVAIGLKYVLKKTKVQK